MSITTNQIQSILGSNGNVVGPDGDKIGGIGQIYVDDTTGDPAWVSVKTGLFGTSQSFVPLEGGSVSGNDISVAYSKDKVKDAPRIDDDGKLSPEEEQTLYSYYGVGTGAGYTDTDTTRTDEYATTDRTDVVGDRSDVVSDRNDVVGDRTDVVGDRTDVSDRETVGHDTSGPTTDDAMTLSEERLNVGTQTTEAGRARLRKYVVTEQVTQTVPVSHEEVRLEREPITDANIGDATSGPAISEEEHEVILHAERPVVEKEAVPVERVRLDTETVTDNVQVTEEVRKEQVDTDVDGDTTTRGGVDGDTTTRGGVDGDTTTRR